MAMEVQMALKCLFFNFEDFWLADCLVEFQDSKTNCTEGSTVTIGSVGWLKCVVCGRCVRFFVLWNWKYHSPFFKTPACQGLTIVLKNFKIPTLILPRGCCHCDLWPVTCDLWRPRKKLSFFFIFQFYVFHLTTYEDMSSRFFFWRGRGFFGLAVLGRFLIL